MMIKSNFSFAIPDWIYWIAQDASGVWWGYSVEPLRYDQGWYENEVGDYVRLGATPADNWQNSLLKVKGQRLKVKGIYKKFTSSII